MEFLFGTWFPGRDRVVLETRWCEDCGFLCYAPRPEAADIDAKYRALMELGVAPGSGGADRPRAERVHRELGGARRVLDVGGGDGRLLAPFAERGAECFVVDYNREPAAGVTWLAETVDAVSPGERFDAAILSHVLEHVADPAGLVRSVAALLEPAGRLYAEVPLEIWNGTPVGRDPLTHVNWFTCASLEQLLRRHGLVPQRVRACWGTYADARLEVAIAVAVPGRAIPAPGAARETERRLRPSPVARVRRRAARIRSGC